ncbi:thioesterase II family protein [Hamadaea tsunoensis]|uniref:thioesterase II family protein n=1 Tax=Hamadaea tsunoensis TaxID=53368 RepID=UPI000410B37F|nr:alpha/beta fold hydrolase [Hamadaea tsunoensis]
MSAVTENLSLWFRQFHPAPAAPLRLVCFPHAGGAATFYFPVARALAPGVDVVAVQYPGRQDRRGEACVDDIERLADLVVAELRPLCDRPVAFFGHSMGAMVAYEVARRLEAEGIVPIGLFASGRRAPSTRRHETVHLRDDDGIVRALRELSGTDAAVLADDELVRMILPAIRGDYKAVETYAHTPGRELTCPVHVLIGQADEMSTVDEAEAWRRHTTGPCTVEVFPGGHFFLVEQAPAVLASLRARLADWRTNP